VADTRALRVQRKALHIIEAGHRDVVLLIAWCITQWLCAIPHCSLPHPRNLRLSASALGWLAHSSLPHTFGILAILIALGHSVLAMSGEESLLRSTPKLKAQAAEPQEGRMVIFVYSLVFTSLVSFFAVMIIPDDCPPALSRELDWRLAMNLEGP